MSRYFTSPPPVYARNWANGQNLVESTKIERQIVAPRKVQRKEKEKKKEKKQKKEKSLKQQYFPTKQLSHESEKSCLTEEHVGYLSDGSQNSKKRRREASPAVESNIKATPVAGNPLRIRFVFKKPKESEVVPQEELVCSTSGSERPSEILSSVSLAKTCDINENLPSTSLASDKNAILSDSKKRKKHKTTKESWYNALFDEWVPPCISLEEDKDDSDDWLFGTSRQANATDKTAMKNDEHMKMNLHRAGESSFLPRAQFLSEVGIFSLPYTVPF